MSFSFVILDLENKVDLSFVNAYLNKEYDDYQLIYCSSNVVNNLGDNVNSLVFNKNEDSEKILNSVISYCNKDNIVVVRKFTTCEEIKLQTSALKNENEIVYFEKKVSKVGNFFWKIIHKLALWIFYKDLLLINNSCVTFGEQAASVLKVLNTPSNAMRTFSWQGLNFIPVVGGTRHKFKYNKLKSSLLTFVPLGISVLFVTLFFILNAKLDFLSKFIFWAIIIFGFILGMVFSVHWFIKSKMGENISDKANIILKGDEKNGKN